MISERDRYLFDLRGYVVVPEVLDAAEVAELTEVVDRIAPPATPEEPKQRFGGFLAHKAFQALLDHPRLLPYLTDWVGESFRIDHAYGFSFVKGADQLDLHLGNTPYLPSSSYVYRDGRIHSGLTVVIYALTDAGPGDGGFCCVPGSHKANLPVPPPMAGLHDLEAVVQPEMKAGDALIFTEALTHGTLPWTSDRPRKALLYKYTPGHMAWANRPPMPELEATLTPRQRKLFEPPYVFEGEHGYRRSVDADDDAADSLESSAG